MSRINSVITFSLGIRMIKFSTEYVNIKSSEYHNYSSTFDWFYPMLVKPVLRYITQILNVAHPL